jgi:serine/threonine protein kinase/TPR repeat protein
MKTCPQCDTGYPDSQTACPMHGLLLNEIRELRPGMVIHKTYRIVRKLGQGGMGTVYLAQHIHMGEPRALKFLSPELSRDQALTSRFLREVRTLRQIRNRNVVDCGDLEAAEDDSLFFSMEFVDGPDLRAFLRDAPQPFDVSLALFIARNIAEGLGAAHAKGMVHRDIKPENILMAHEGDSWLPKIADFGIVATKESSTAYTKTGGTLLTMAYAAPEQWRGTPAASLDGRTDLYALGCLLFEMLTGQTPFQAENYEGWARQHQTTPPQPPSTLRPELTSWRSLDALVLHLLAKDREQRPKDVAELLGLLDAVQYLPSQTHMETLPMPRAQGPYKTPEDKTPKPSRISAFLRRKWPRGVVIFLAAVFAASAILGIIAELNEIVWAFFAVVLFLTLTIIAAWMRFGFRRIWVIAGSIFLGIFAVPSFAVCCLTFFIFFRAYSDNLGQRRNMAEMYLNGEFPFMRDTARGENLYRRACDGGDSLSCMTLGDAFQQGQNHEKNYAQAEIYYTKACDGGNASGCFNLGVMYEHGTGVAKDDSRAVALYNKGCDAGGFFLCDYLGALYANGTGVARDYSRAVTFLTKACDAGDGGGCGNLGAMYENGSGVAKDVSRAVTLYSKACDGGDGHGCSNLGVLYRDGIGVSKDTAEAQRLLRKGCSMGNQYGCDRLKEIK